MDSPEQNVAAISCAELQQKIERGDRFYLLETLPPSYFRHSHLPGAINLPVEEIPFRARKLLCEADAEIVVYCFDEKCEAAGNAAQMLRNMGYQNIRAYHGGKADWRAAGLPLEGESRSLRLCV